MLVRMLPEEPLHTAGGDAHGAATVEDSFLESYKYTHLVVVSVLGIYPREMKTTVHTKMHTRMSRGWPGGAVVVRLLCFGTLGFANLDPGCGPTHFSSSHAVAASHIQSGGRWAQMLAQGQSSSAKRRGLVADVSSGIMFLKKKEKLHILQL